jgi:hypothetical protein
MRKLSTKHLSVDFVEPVLQRLELIFNTTALICGFSAQDDCSGSKAAIEALVKPSEVPSTADMNIGVMLAFTLTLDRHHDWEG